MAALVRAIRRQQGFTLESLADATGLTKSYLSKIERQRSTPSIAVALRIARALQVDVGELFADDAEKGRLLVEPHASAGTERYRPIAAGMLGKAMSPFRVRPSRRFAAGPHPEHPGQEFIYVCSGEIELDYSGQLVTLGVGDCAYLDSSVAHRIRSTSPTDAEVILVAYNEPH